MRSRRTSAEHQEAVARRLAQLSAELGATRAEHVARASGGEWWSDHTRVTPTAPGLRVVPAPAAPPVPVAPADPVPDPPPIPVPGRHAAARRGARLADVLVPATLRGRVALGPGPLAVVALLVALGMAVTAWLVVRGDPDRPTIAAPATGEAMVTLPSSDPGHGGGAPATPAAERGSVTVDVAGKVRRPGIAVLDAGARVVDALKAAGGARPGVDLSSLNLARVLVDGEQILVGSAAPPAGVAPPLGDPAAPAGELVNLNVATAAELEALPEVGPVTAAAIVTWRETNGAFTSVEELLEIDGIGEATLAQIAPYATV